MLISAGQFVAVGQATETDLAQALFYPKVIAIGQVTETDGAWMLHHVGIAEFPPLPCWPRWPRPTSRPASAGRSEGEWLRCWLTHD